MIPDDLRSLFLEKFIIVGDHDFYIFLIEYGFQRINSYQANELSPEKELMNLYFTFLDYYRAEENEYYFSIAKHCRRAAHAIYREMIRQEVVEYNPGFLNLVVDNDGN